MPPARRPAGPVADRAGAGDAVGDGGPDGPAALTAGEGKPQQLIVTTFAFYGRGRADGAIAASGLIRLMASLDVPAPAVRSALSRLKKRGVLLSTRAGSAAAYRLDPDLADVFREGDERIFSARRSRPGDRWLLASFSVPESQRHLRHQLRTILARRGFGTVGSGLWVAPELVAPHIRRDLERAHLLEYVELFAAEHLTGRDLATEVATWWDLPTLAAHYAGFNDRFAAMLARWEAGGQELDDEQAFADHVLAVTAWRRLPYLDPGLPVEALPESWPGLRAQEIFAALHERLREPARRHATAVLGS